MLKDAEAVLLPWHHFANEAPMEHIRQWMKRDWRAIKRQLKEEHGLEIPDGMEPHWVAPGSAVFWRNNTVIQFKRDPDKGERHNLEEILEKSLDEWKPTSPLPVGNASQFYRYLTKKDFRLRPPRSGLEAGSPELIEAVEVADQPEVPDKEAYLCLRHDFSAPNWRGYINHTKFWKEPPDLSQMPDEIREAMQGNDYYCAIHNVGFLNLKGATHHVKDSAQKHIVPQPHVKAADMKVVQPKKDKTLVGAA